MFKDDTTLEAVMSRYKLGLDHLQAHQFELPLTIHPGWRDRLLFNLGKILVALGSRLQQKHAIATQAPYRPAYPVS